MTNDLDPRQRRRDPRGKVRLAAMRPDRLTASDGLTLTADASLRDALALATAVAADVRRARYVAANVARARGRERTARRAMARLDAAVTRADSVRPVAAAAGADALAAHDARRALLARAADRAYALATRASADRAALTDALPWSRAVMGSAAASWVALSTYTRALPTGAAVEAVADAGSVAAALATLPAGTLTRGSLSLSYVIGKRQSLPAPVAAASGAPRPVRPLTRRQRRALATRGRNADRCAALLADGRMTARQYLDALARIYARPARYVHAR